MKPLLIVALAALLAPCPCFADYIELSVFPMGGLCMRTAPQGVPFSVYVVHQAYSGAVASRWKIDDTSGFIHLADAPSAGLVWVGNPYTGVAIDYQSCMTGSVLIWQLTLLNPGLNPLGCYQLRVQPFPGDVFTTVVDCTQVERAASGGYFSFNESAGCDDCAGPVESATWGGVKALYR